MIYYQGDKSILLGVWSSPGGRQGALVHKQQNSDTGVKYETRISFGETGLSLNRALVRTKRGMRKATAKLEIKKHIKSPLYALREVKER